MELIIFLMGGTFYGFVELTFRGYTHWTMVLTGGVIVLTFYYLLPFFMELPIFIASFSGALIITFYEFTVGVIVNLWFKWNVWDYSDKFANVLGQICPLYTLYWFAICLAFFTLIKYNESMPF